MTIWYGVIGEGWNYSYDAFANSRDELKELLRKGYNDWDRQMQDLGGLEIPFEEYWEEALVREVEIGKVYIEGSDTPVGEKVR